MVEIIDGLDKTEREQAMKKLHEMAHLAPKSIVNLLKQQGLVWQGMNNDFRTIVQRCRECAQYDELGVKSAPLKTITSNQPFSHVQVDLITNIPKDRGFANIFVAVCVMTGYVYLKALKSKSAMIMVATLE